MQLLQLTFRHATTDDADLLYEWRNHPSTRAMMFDSEPFTFESHLAWLNDVLDSPDRLLVLGCVNGVPVGSVRIDSPTPEEGEVSINVNPNLRGKGLGTALLRKTVETVPADTLLIARIKPTNTASVRAFAKAGFVEQLRTESEVVMVATAKNV